MNKAVLAAAILAAVFLFPEDGQADEVVASWYGWDFAGLPTASGDPYDPTEYTAASKHLPFGTVLYVEHEGWGTTVEITDRGPYTPGRDLDLSLAAADAIGLTDEGVSGVYVEILYIPEEE